MAEERWFTEQELGLMSRPTMDRAIEAIEAGDSELALELCKGMRHEWRFLHDLMAESMLGLVTYIQQQQGDDGVAAAWEESRRRGWKMPGVSTSTIWASPAMATPRTGKRVVCTFWVTIDTLAPTRRLVSVDLPALGAPMMAAKPARVVIRLPVC